MKTFSQISPYQSTIRKAVHISGVGLHSGDRIKMTLSPAGANSGIRFVRKELETNKTVPALTPPWQRQSLKAMLP